MRFKIRHAQLQDDRPPTATHVPRPQGDVRQGITAPTIRKPITFQQPQATTATVTSRQLSPETGPWSKQGSVNVPQQRSGALKTTLGTTPTSTGGFRGNSASGTGLVDQRSFQFPNVTPWATLTSSAKQNYSRRENRRHK